MTKYTVIIDPLDPVNNDGTMFENVMEYKMLSDRVFYVAGSDFENWIILKEGQAVQVTDEEPNT